MPSRFADAMLLWFAKEGHHAGLSNGLKMICGCNFILSLLHNLERLSIGQSDWGGGGIWGSDMGPRISEIDTYIGARVRSLREIRGLSRETIAGALNISHQQFQKYESGQNRITAGRLAIIAQVLGVQVSYLYEGLPEPAVFEPPVAPTIVPPVPITPQCLTLIELFMRIRSPSARRSVIQLVHTLARGDEDTL